MTIEQSAVTKLVEERWNEAAPDFDSCPGHGIHSTKEKEIWKKLLENQIGKKSCDILDAGTGTGVIAILLAEMGHKLTGIDIAEEMLEIAKKKAENLNYDINFLKGDAAKTPFEDNKFDVVVNRHLFWTIPEPSNTAAEWLRVLKPGGKLVIIDGDWDNYSSYKKIWKKLSNVLIFITEKRNPWSSKGFKDFEKEMPLKLQKRPAADIKLFDELGLKASVKYFKDPRGYNFVNKIKYGYYDRFIITVKKPV